MASAGSVLFVPKQPKHNLRCQCSLVKGFKAEELVGGSTVMSDPDKIFQQDESQLRFLRMPDDPEEVLFDLKEDFERFMLFERLETIERVLKAHDIATEINKEKTSVEDELTNQLLGLQLEPEVVCRRGLLTELLISPYSLGMTNKGGWTVGATKYKNKIFLSRIARPKEDWGTEEERNLATYCGNKFEQYVTKRTLDGPSIADLGEVVDTGKGFYTLTKARLGKHNLVFAGEVDACDADVQGPNGSRTYVQFKTAVRMEEPPKYFQSLKLLRWWAQSVLVGVPRIICGIRDRDYIVYEVKTYNVNDLQHAANGNWSPCVCFTFLDSLLTHIQEVFKDAPNDHRVVHVFECSPTTRRVSHREEPAGSEHCFLPDWYTTE